MKLVVASTGFKFSLISVLFFLAVLSLLVSLGFWQLGRADEKKELLAQQQQSTNEKSVDLLNLIGNGSKDFRYRKTKITGYYDQNHQYLIDNQIINGRVGYFVMTPFIVDGIKRAVLVNRGWVPLNKNRKILPDIKIDSVKETLSGRINNFPVVGIKLAGAEIPTDNWPSVVQIADHEVLSEKLGYPIFPFQIELDAGIKRGYVRDWKRNTTMPPEKHVAYALQWFGLAITLTILYIGFNRIKQVNE